jgi:plastocyanin
VNRHPRIVAAAGIAAAAVLFSPVAAHAATKKVTEGLPVKDQAKFIGKLKVDAIDFFPHTVTVHVGDSIRFSPTAFHQIDFPPKGQGPIQVITASTPIQNSNDSAGQPFWFNGLPNFGFNPELVSGKPTVDYSVTKRARKHGRHVTYTGKNRVTTPIPFDAGPKPLTIKFAKVGNFKYFCDLHNGMHGLVKVKPKHDRIPGAKADAKTLSKQVARDYKIARKLPKAQQAPNTISVGNAGRFGVEYFGYLPGTTTVPVGTTITFHMTPDSFENHTATTGPGIPEQDSNSFLGQIAASFFRANFLAPGVYPSTKPGDPSVVNKSTHGDGFWNSGVLGVRKTSLPVPSSASVTFTAPGTYDFWCMVHPQMHGRVIVQ